jgi:hypothetical protein
MAAYNQRRQELPTNAPDVVEHLPTYKKDQRTCGGALKNASAEVIKKLNKVI